MFAQGGAKCLNNDNNHKNQSSGNMRSNSVLIIWLEDGDRKKAQRELRVKLKS
jgi:hypothetical protein